MQLMLPGAWSVKWADIGKGGGRGPGGRRGGEWVGGWEGWGGG